MSLNSTHREADHLLAAPRAMSSSSARHDYGANALLGSSPSALSVSDKSGNGWRRSRGLSDTSQRSAGIVSTGTPGGTVTSANMHGHGNRGPPPDNLEQIRNMSELLVPYFDDNRAFGSPPRRSNVRWYALVAVMVVVVVITVSAVFGSRGGSSDSSGAPASSVITASGTGSAGSGSASASATSTGSSSASSSSSASPSGTATASNSASASASATASASPSASATGSGSPSASSTGTATGTGTGTGSGGYVGPPIQGPATVKRWKIFDSTGAELFVRGVVYDPLDGAHDPLDASHDPIANTRRTYWSRDLKEFGRLGVNVVRVLYVDVDSSHNEFMSAAAQQGIYVWVAVTNTSLAGSIQTDGWSYTLPMLDRSVAIANEFAQYDNTLCLEVGQGVTAGASANTGELAYVKAWIRDLRQSLQSATRAIPVAYSLAAEPSAQGEQWVNSARYLMCGDSDTQVQLLGLSVFSWCDPSTPLSQTQYDVIRRKGKSLPSPLVLSGYGCYSSGSRTFYQNNAIFGSLAEANSLSGGIVYRYARTSHDPSAGLVVTSTTLPGVVTELPSFSALSNNFVTLARNGLPHGVNSRTWYPFPRLSPSCPSVSSTWGVDGESLPPTAKRARCDDITYPNQASCVPNDPTDLVGAISVLQQLCPSGGSGDQPCSEVASDPSSGRYGAYSTCGVVAQVTYAMSYAYDQGGSCDYDGYASPSLP